MQVLICMGIMWGRKFAVCQKSFFGHILVFADHNAVLAVLGKSALE